MAHQNGCYYITVFKIEGHDTWKLHTATKKQQFNIETQKENFPKVLASKVFVLNRVTGIINEL